ncbi:MAG: class I SAM-dependent methyltransferase [Promethearchaeota archaeon]
MNKPLKIYHISYYAFHLFRILSQHVPYFKNLFRLLIFLSFPSNQESMDFLGTALWDYSSNNLKSKFKFHQYCWQKKYNAYAYEVDLRRYFRTLPDLTYLERTLLDLSHGNILDIGSNTGYYIPFLMKKGVTRGIEISPTTNQLARKNGINNCITGDIFNYKFKLTFDTITLLESDIAFSGTLFRLKKLMKIFYKLLNLNGQVLLIMRDIRTLKYWRVVYTPSYNGCFGIPFKLLYLNINFLKRIAQKYNFQFMLLGKEGPPEQRFYLIKLLKY